MGPSNSGPNPFRMANYLRNRLPNIDVTIFLSKIICFIITYTYICIEINGWIDGWMIVVCACRVSFSIPQSGTDGQRVRYGVAQRALDGKRDRQHHQFQCIIFWNFASQLNTLGMSLGHFAILHMVREVNHNSKWP